MREVPEQILAVDSGLGVSLAAVGIGNDGAARHVGPTDGQGVCNINVGHRGRAVRLGLQGKVGKRMTGIKIYP